ncbi:MYND-type zinc finger-containing chromatin reader ZMYND8-like isoform X2 [Watersipora subatra]|uniref:MYND-type zinc finger-containing chromatin reader ZMYND8-like isoform X2 n=1 Tax=Watersipora subatra TaxID=2589382 RepID=UPI00355C63E4
MSDASSTAGEPKQRITRSSIERSNSPMATQGQDSSGAAASELNSAETASLVKRSKMGIVSPTPTPQVTRRSLRSSNKLNTDEESDQYCWRCRKDGSVIPCQLCPRVFHLKCLDLTANPVDDWICMECEKVMRSEHEDTKPRALVNLSMDQLITCLQFALERMKIPNSEVFQVPVDPAMEPEYHNIIAHPMDMSQLEKNTKKKMYGSTQAFLSDAMWILHNSVLYNGVHNKYTMTAKSVLKMCRNQMTEIETCPDCFLASCTQEANWFCKPCRFSHPLVWAKLKGYPFWPAKALRENDGQVDCRFFGAHDKAWLPSNSVFMLSSEPPAPVKNKKGSGFEEAMVELEKYITKFKARYGTFSYAPPKEPYRADYGQTPVTDSKKRKLVPVSANEEPQAKKQTESPVVKEEKPVVKSEPAKPGVFTISDDLLAGSTDFTLVNYEEIAPIVTSSVVSKIEQALKMAQADDASTVNGDIKKENSQEGSNAVGVSDTIPTKSDSNRFVAQTDNPVTSLEVKSLSQPIKSVAAATVQSTETPEETPEPKGGQQTVTEDMKVSEQPTPSQHVQSAESAIAAELKEDIVEPASDAMDVGSTPSITATDPEYTQKLERTIASCKTSLGVDTVEASSQYKSKSDSDDEIESDEEVIHNGRRKIRYSQYVKRKQRKDVREILTEKELEVTRQMLDVMREGIQPVIRDIVRQKLLGSPLKLSEGSQSQSETKSLSHSSRLSTTNQKTAEVGISSKATPEDSVSPSVNISSDAIPKGEPLVEHTNNENSQDTSIDPSVGRELEEKLIWKHKCEIEAIKHNAELTAMEMRKSIELEKERALWRLRKQLEHKFKKIIEETKKKQWCAMCGKEAIFYCCWNTSYCDYPCQQKHWPNHLKTCAQISKDDGVEKKVVQQHPRTQSPGNTSTESGHSASAPPPYMSTSSSTQGEVSASPQYQIMQGQQVQYMPAPGSVPPNVYQAQLPVQAMPIQSGPRIPVSASAAPMLYPVMTPPSAPQGPPQPQSYMLSQRQPYRLAPKYN